MGKDILLFTQLINECLSAGLKLNIFPLEPATFRLPINCDLIAEILAHFYREDALEHFLRQLRRQFGYRALNSKQSLSLTLKVFLIFV